MGLTNMSLFVVWWVVLILTLLDTILSGRRFQYLLAPERNEYLYASVLQYAGARLVTLLMHQYAGARLVTLLMHQIWTRDLFFVVRLVNLLNLVYLVCKVLIPNWKDFLRTDLPASCLWSRVSHLGFLFISETRPWPFIVVAHKPIAACCLLPFEIVDILGLISVRVTQVASKQYSSYGLNIPSDFFSTCQECSFPS